MKSSRLPNIGKELEKKLESICIRNPDELEKSFDTVVDPGAVLCVAIASVLGHGLSDFAVPNAFDVQASRIVAAFAH